MSGHMDQSRSSFAAAHPVELIERSAERVGELAESGARRRRGPALDVRDALAGCPDAKPELFLSQAETLSLGSNEASNIHRTDILEVNFHKSSGEQMYGCALQVESDIQAVMRGDGKLLAAKRTELKWSRERLGRSLVPPFSAKTVENHEKGKHPIDHEMVVRYAKAMGCRPSELAAPEAAEGVTRLPPAGTGDLRPITRLLNDGRCNPISDPELDHLARHLQDGNSPELDDLEIHLLAHRAERDKTPAASKRFTDAVLRVAKERGQREREPTTQMRALPGPHKKKLLTR